MWFTPFSALALLASLHTQDSAPDVTALFHEHCASCHGETGDGQGWAELDRQARSFKEGGFSFGNTPETILRTITHGIPGSPMPAFDRALTEAQRKALAQHVIALGPPDMASEPSNTEMVITDRPLIVRGGLPPIVDGAEPQPRGLLLGTLEGLTFEYRTDDVRLLGVRSGAFCDRTDWTGRGGTRLKPLGQVVVLQEGGDPQPTFWAGAVGTGTPLECRLAGTAATAARPSLSYWLVHPEDGRVARVHEEVESVTSAVGIGSRRHLRIEGQAGSSRFALAVASADAPMDESPLAHPELHSTLILFPSFGPPAEPYTCSAGMPQSDGRLRWVRIDTGPAAENSVVTRLDRAGDRHTMDFEFNLEAGESRTITVTEFLLSDPQPEALRALQELPR